MRQAQKTVYYCEHCRKHGLSRHAMERHERHCTMNPSRICRWSGNHEPDTKRWAAVMRSREPLTRLDIDWLRDETEGCPACMLAALRQSGVADFHYNGGERIFDYDEAVKDARESERERNFREAQYEVYW